MNKPIIVTGAAGFIGYHLSKKLLEEGINVIGIDNLNDYYNVNLKEKRLENLSKVSLKKNSWKFIKTDLIDKEKILEIFKKYKPDKVVNLAAQAGVRYSLENPSSYIYSNIVGFSNILEGCKVSEVKNLLYASSSSVYGGNTKVPFSENDPVNHPVSLYAATKRSNELLAHVYSHLYGISCTGLRFFTVYGPWGRPDMAPMIFADAIIKKKLVRLFNYGDMSRSFTFIDDVIEIIIKLINKPSTTNKSFDSSNPESHSSWCPNRIFNIGNEKSIKLLDFITCLEEELGIEAKKEFCPMGKEDVINTSCSNENLKEWIGDYPKTSLSKGVKVFINWYKDFYTQ